MDKESSSAVYFGFAAFWALSFALSVVEKDWWFAPFELGFFVYNLCKGLGEVC